MIILISSAMYLDAQFISKLKDFNIIKKMQNFIIKICIYNRTNDIKTLFSLLYCACFSYEIQSPKKNKGQIQFGIHIISSQANRCVSQLNICLAFTSSESSCVNL